MQKTAVIVQARLGSMRLPAKVLLPLPTGRTVLGEVLYQCWRIPTVDVVVCAIPDTAENDIVAAHVHPNVKLVRGPEHDVLARYAKAAEAVDADVIMRITSDCPLIDPEVCGWVLRHIDGVDYCSNVERRVWPQGYDCQVFTRRMLNWANEHAKEKSDREHVCPIMERGTSGLQRRNISTPINRSHERLTLDTLSDYIKIWNVLQDQMREAT